MAKYIPKNEAFKALGKTLGIGTDKVKTLLKSAKAENIANVSEDRQEELIERIQEQAKAGKIQLKGRIDPRAQRKSVVGAIAALRQGPAKNGQDKEKDSKNRIIRRSAPPLTARGGRPLLKEEGILEDNPLISGSSLARQTTKQKPQEQTKPKGKISLGMDVSGGFDFEPDNHRPEPPELAI